MRIREWSSDVCSAGLRHGPPKVIHYFGRDAAERRHVLGRTLSSAIAIDGRALSATKTGKNLALDVDAGEAGFRRLSRVRHVYRPALLGFARASAREGREDGGHLGGAAPALRCRSEGDTSELQSLMRISYA